ncbi:MAG: hypothetical protein IJE03_03760, partial [Ruminiclostridium sp.]|nr:hypothetical protein [Ruminiclostridium sp.]
MQAEKSFPARTCRAGKRIYPYFAVATAKLYEVFRHGKTAPEWEPFLHSIIQYFFAQPMPTPPSPV